MGTHSWYECDNLSIFGFFVVDTYSVTIQSLVYKNTYHALFCDLDEEIVDNDLDLSPTIFPSNRTIRSAFPVSVRKLPTAHILQTCKKWRPYNGR